MKFHLNLTRSVEWITGDDNFKAEHQFLNISLILGCFFFFFFLVINVYFQIDMVLGTIKLAGVVLSLLLFYFSRFKQSFVITSNIFFIYLIASYFLIGARNAGVTGGIAPVYTAILALMLFIVSGPNLVFLFTLWIMSITGLFVLEYFHPEFIMPYANRGQKYMDLYLSYASGIGMISMVVVLVKKLYLKEKLTAKEMMKKYRTYNTDIKKRILNNRNALTKREREICELILSGQNNQEIANLLFISEGTVKCHINSIYKKLGTKKRVDILDHYPKL